ncbi:MAG: GAF domain-containing sensor histidine kinase [Cyanobacteria bacterium J06621_8]
MIQVPPVELGLSVSNMTQLKNQLFCRMDGLTTTQRTERRRTTLTELGLLTSDAVPLFEATTQKAAVFTDMPISLLTIAVDDQLWFKSAVGLSTNAMTAQLAAQRQLSLQESFASYVIDSQQPLFIENTLSHAIFARSILAQHYGIKTYLGVPLISSDEVCLGTLEVMSFEQKQLNQRDVEHLILLASSCLKEFEYSQLTQQPVGESIISQNRLSWQSPGQKIMGLNAPTHHAAKMAKVNNRAEMSDLEQKLSLENPGTNPIKLKLVSQLTQELRTPLTSVIGMASVLHREVYGPLTVKQREYLEIIHDSGQNLISLVDEIVSLGVLSDYSTQLNNAAIDVEMLCQQVVNSLADMAKQKQQELRLSIEPGNRIWSLDKGKIRQGIYYLIVSLLEISEPGGEIQIHVSRRDRMLNIAFGVSHPWLGENLGQNKPHTQTVAQALKFSHASKNEHREAEVGLGLMGNHQLLTTSTLMMAIDDQQTLDNNNKIPRDILGLLLCCHLIELHQGRVVVQGSLNSSYRYVLQFPFAQSIKE